MNDFKHPQEFDPKLNDEILFAFAKMMQEVFYTVEESVNDPFDDNSSRGTALYVRNKNRLFSFLPDHLQSLVNISISNNRVTAKVGRWICIFDASINNNYYSKILKLISNLNAKQPDLFDYDDTDELVGVFKLAQPKNKEDEPMVVFYGYNLSGQKISQCSALPTTSSLYIVQDDLPETNDIPSAPVDPLDDSSNKKDSNG